MGAMCNYSNVVASKLNIVSGLKEGMFKMPQNPNLLLITIICCCAFFVPFMERLINQMIPSLVPYFASSPKGLIDSFSNAELFISFLSHQDNSQFFS